MALTPEQKKNLLIGGGVGALGMLGVILLGRSRADQQDPAQLAPAPVRARAEHHKRRRRRDRDDDGERGERGDRHDGNERGGYGRRKKRRRRDAGPDVSVGQRPQQLIFPTPRHDEGPGASIVRLNDRVRGFVRELGNTMSQSEQRWAVMHPVWEREVLPFLTEWEVFGRDTTRWSWSAFDRWATRWNAIVARMTALLPSKERGRGQ